MAFRRSALKGLQPQVTESGGYEKIKSLSVTDVPTALYRIHLAPLIHTLAASLTSTALRLRAVRLNSAKRGVSHNGTQ